MYERTKDGRITIPFHMVGIGMDKMGFHLDQQLFDFMGEHNFKRLTQKQIKKARLQTFKRFYKII